MTFVLYSSYQKLQDMVSWLLAPDTCVLCGMPAKDFWQLVTWEPRSAHEKYLPLFFCVFSCTLTLTRNIILYPDSFSSYDFQFSRKNKRESYTAFVLKLNKGLHARDYYTSEKSYSIFVCLFLAVCSLNWKIAIQYLYFGSYSYSLNSGTYPISVFKKLFLSLILAYSQIQYLSPSFEKCSVQFSSVAQLCLTLCNPMNHSTPGLPVQNQLPEFT